MQQPLSCVECALILAVNSRSTPYTVFIITKTVSHSRVDYCFADGWVSDGMSMGFSYVEGMPRCFLRYPYMVGELNPLHR